MGVCCFNRLRLDRARRTAADHRGPWKCRKGTTPTRNTSTSSCPTIPRLFIRPMFGNFVGVCEQEHVRRPVRPHHRGQAVRGGQELLESTERPCVDPPERPMGRYTGLPEMWNSRAPAMRRGPRLGVEKAFEHVAGLPPKGPKASKPKPEIAPDAGPCSPRRPSNARAGDATSSDRLPVSTSSVRTSAPTSGQWYLCRAFFSSASSRRP